MYQMKQVSKGRKDTGRLTRRVDGSGGLARVGGEGSVDRVRVGDDALGALDVGVVAACGEKIRQQSARLSDCHRREGRHVHGDVVGVAAGGGLTVKELAPSLVALVDDLDGVLLRLGLAGEGEDVLRVARMSA